MAGDSLNKSVTRDKTILCQRMYVNRSYLYTEFDRGPSIRYLITKTCPAGMICAASRFTFGVEMLFCLGQLSFSLFPDFPYTAASA